GRLVGALRAAWLDDRGHAVVERCLRPVREGEERIRREHRAFGVVAVLACLVERELDGVDAARLAAADADRREAPRDHDRVRADVLAHAPREQEVAPKLLARLAARDLDPLAALDVPVPVLDAQAPPDPL